MLPTKIDSLIDITSSIHSLPPSMVRDMVFYQFKIIKDYSMGKLDIPALDIRRLGRFYVRRSVLNYVLLKWVPYARKHLWAKEKLFRVWKLRKHALNYEYYKSYKSRFGSWHCGRPAD